MASLEKGRKLLQKKGQAMVPFSSLIVTKTVMLNLISLNNSIDHHIRAVTQLTLGGVYEQNTPSLAAWLILPLLFLAPAVLGQEAEKKMPVRPASEGVQCEPDTCESKVFYLPNFPTPNEFQDVVNTFRLILDAPRVSANQSEHAVSLQGTPEQLAIAEKLETVLESLWSSGGHNWSSVLVYEQLAYREVGQVQNLNEASGQFASIGGPPQKTALELSPACALFATGMR